MSSVRRSAAALAIAIGTLGTAGVISLATASLSSAQPACTDVWTGPDTGTTDWSASASNWSDALPSGSSVVCIDEAGTYTVVFDGSNTPAAVEVGGSTSGTQTLEIDSSNMSTTQPNFVESGGSLDLAPASSANAEISGSTLTVDAGGTLTSTGSSDEADIESALDNQGTVTLGATTNHIGVDASNEGSFTVSSGATLTSDGSFTDDAGTLDVGGTFDASNTFIQSGATESGNPVDVSGTLADSAGTGAFDLVPSGGAVTGTIPSGQIVTVDGVNAVVGTSSTGVTDDGMLILATTSGGYAEISANANSPGLTVASGGTLSSTGTSNQAQIDTPLLNQGTVTLGASSNSGGGGGADITNEGSFTISSGSSFTESAAVFTDASGTITNDGSFTGDNEFVQSGTNESGNPLELGGTLVDSAGTGFFDTLGTNIQGTIPAGQTVTNVATNDPIGTSTAGVTVEGTLICETTTNPNDYCDFSSGNNTYPGITVASGGTLETSGPGSAPLQNVQMTTNIQVEPGGTMTVSNPQTTYAGGGFVISNSGTLQVTATGLLSIGGSSELSSTGTIGVAVGSGQALTLGIIKDTSLCDIDGGTLAVTTVGSPAPNTVVMDTANGVGTGFASGSFGIYYYTVSDAGGEIDVTPATAFSASATSFSAAENEPLTPQVASFDTNGEPGTYSATVNYGDGTGTQAGTVNLSGDSGTVTGPSHSYTAPGTYTVTTTVSTTAGTTIPVSESVTVTGPRITGLSKTTVAPNKSISTTVSGTNFDGTGTFTTSNPTELSVASSKFVAATKKHGAEYKVKLKATKKAPAEQVSITLTQTGTEAGKTTDTNAITIS